MKIISTPALYLLLFFPALCFSQGYVPGYIVQANGDTAHGMVKHPFGNHYGVKFKDSAGIKKDISTNDVKAFYIEGEGVYRVIAFAKDGSRHMVQVRIDGYLSYYEVQLGVSYDSYYYILEKKDGSQVWYSADLFSGFKATTRRFLADDTVLCEKIKEGKYGKKDILKIVEEYNIYHSSQK